MNWLNVFGATGQGLGALGGIYAALNPPTARCSPGQTSNTCPVCSNGSAGTQTCTSDGKGYSACVCDDAGAATPEAGTVDAGSPMTPPGPPPVPNTCNMGAPWNVAFNDTTAGPCAVLQDTPDTGADGGNSVASTQITQCYSNGDFFDPTTNQMLSSFACGSSSYTYVLRLPQSRNHRAVEPLAAPVQAGHAVRYVRGIIANC